MAGGLCVETLNFVPVFISLSLFPFLSLPPPFLSLSPPSLPPSLSLSLSLPLSFSAAETEGRRRMISKSFHYQLKNREKQPLVGRLSILHY